MTSKAPGFDVTTGGANSVSRQWSLRMVYAGDTSIPNFKDHDDANIFYSHTRNEWVEMQIMYQTWDKKYCDNVNGARRVVTVRNSPDGVNWSDDWGCLDNPQTSEVPTFI